ncbi:MAG: alcohol dehydrogenase catalytic domain-containing protein [Armatimonadota bacterium]|nr:alcohol dehydrogenase catalytic domain-containing protein [Armatimonadota bacterium]
MKAALFHGGRQVSVEDVPDPAIAAPDDCLVRVMVSGICGTDKRFFVAEEPTEGIMGHEAVGEVVAVGESVTGVGEGDRVAVYNLIGCGHCGYCRQGRFTYCREPRGSVNGGYGELLVAPERNLLPVPDWLDWERACLMTDVMGTPVKAVRIADVEEGDTVVVLGCGPIGLGTVQAAVARKARVMAVDPVEPRTEAARRFGAEVGCPATGEDAVSCAMEWTGVGADVAFDCTGAEGAAVTALECLRPGGTGMCVGANMQMTFSPWRHIISRDATLGGSWYLHLEDYAECLRLQRAGLIDPLPMITHRVPLEEIHSGFELCVDQPESCIKVVVMIGLR